MEERERQESRRKALHFPTMAAAIDWIREHKPCELIQMGNKMADTPDFEMEDLEEMIDFLNPYIANHAEGSKERQGFTFAQIALLYIRDKVKREDFAEYRKKFLPGYWPKFEIVQEFATREEADQWRASGKAKDHDHVKIAGKGHQVIVVNGKPYFIVIPFPEELDSPEWQGDSEDDSE